MKPCMAPSAGHLTVVIFHIRGCRYIKIAYTFPIYSEENKHLNTLLFCKFSHLEITEGSEIVIVSVYCERHLN